MYLNPNWRILTVGDGDLSFSHALYRAIKPKKLIASTYDDEHTIKTKYADNAFCDLTKNKVTILTHFDVTNKDTWRRLNNDTFDVIIFQFPLIPAFAGKTAFVENTQKNSLNTLNRALLHQFIKYACELALDKSGPMLCYITSKDVKPYLHWNIEGSLVAGLDASYLGKIPFDISKFPGYKIRNVDRDKHVKDTSGITYVFSPNSNADLKSILTYPDYLTDNHCALCRAGPFHGKEDHQKHINAKKHQQMLVLEHEWKNWLTHFNNKEEL